MRGGKREGAGRKKGSVTKATEVRQEMLARAAADGISPLEYLLSVMRTHEDEARRIDAAKAAAPYVHPRLAAVEHSGGLEISQHEAALSEIEAATATVVNGHAN